MTTPALLFLDVESTGLPEIYRLRHSIELSQLSVISFAAVLYDPLLPRHKRRLFETGEVFVRDDDPIIHPETAIERVVARISHTPVVEQMHRDSGLTEAWIQAVREGQAPAVDVTLNRLVEQIDANVGADRKVLLAGNSVWSLDMPVIQTRAGALSDRLGHQVVDTTSLMRTLQTLGVDTDTLVPDPADRHRAPADLDRSIAQYELAQMCMTYGVGNIPMLHS